METILIEKVGVEAIDDIKSVADIAFRATYNSILSLEQIDYMMEWMYSKDSLQKQILEQNNSYFLARLQDRCVGYAAIRPDLETSLMGINVYHLEKIYLLPECQGGGYGRLLLEKVFNYVLDISANECIVELNVNRNNRARTFYEKMGFRVVREGDFSIGNGFFMNDFIMRLLLKR